MLRLSKDMVVLGMTATDKADAIRKTAAILADAGKVDPAYADSMLKREQQTATYLGNGIAIPHGLRGDGGMIRDTAICVAQFPQGVTWSDGEVVHIAVGIAAKSDEHIQVLANLTDVLQDEAAARRLAATGDPQDVLDILNRDRDQASAPAAGGGSGDLDRYAAYPVREDVTVSGHHGLHARPAAVFAGLAKQFSADVRVAHGAKVANAKSLASLLTLGVESGSTIRILADGGDAKAAVRALAEAVRAGLEEDDAGDDLPDEGTAGAARRGPAPAVDFAGDVRKGVAASPGLAIGPLHRLARPDVLIRDESRGASRETASLEAAMAEARHQLQALHAAVAARAGSKQAAIFLAHQEFLDDPDLAAEAKALIDGGQSAGRAWQIVTDRRAAEMAELSDATLKERANDMRDVGARVLRILAGQTGVLSPAPMPDHPVILAAEDLAPSDTANLDTARVLGIALTAGGPNSHSAILARSLDIPAVVSLGHEIDAVDDGTEVVLDGDHGLLLVAPDADDRRKAEDARDERRAAAQDAKAAAYKPAFTTDGERIEVVANIGRTDEAARAVEAGAEGVGLLRTEFLFLGREEAPTEDEQAAELTRMVEALNGLPLVVRTLDIGGDKDIPFLPMPPEDNPFLGLRGIRLALAKPELFRSQLRAIMRAATRAPEGAVKVMFPMIGTLEEFREAKAMLEEARAEIGAPRVEVGIMVEVPSAALMAPEFAREVDFFSIGTNDLTQYTLAIDRLHPTLTRKADGLHPSVLRLIRAVVDAAHPHGCWVGVCGNMAAERVAAPILIGLGVDELSVSPPAVAGLKAQIRGLSYGECRELAEAALACRTAADVRRLA
ncbi:phosphoenolpyruvate--protein phosphotransferase [Caenispirillum bisanense]|uniref:phosphoenolpyruvate--protein phosphotransferase n=1 Tax=Caenispirillum bisanense TaxID=414052 RepID=A0A286GRQ7_9PROT|nr:phosphoenolpyruvate--protein phosphotransferase [Caenispirillum bisanense]SOD98210.1 phosphocarrier protein FPr [Caenispirillum bisanense]